MRGDFSRFPFDPRKQFNRVLMQQGRVQLDADWNEQAEIVAHRFGESARDVVGADGAPAAEPGFGVVALGGIVCDGTGYQTGDGERFALGEADPFTLEAWVAPRTEDSAGTVVSRLAETAGYALAINKDGTVCFSRGYRNGDERESGNPGPPTLRRFVGDTAVDGGHFSHVAVTYDGADVRIFIDGRLVGMETEIRAGVDADVPLTLGAAGNAEAIADPFDGTIDDVRLWRVARSGDQIRYGLVGNLGNTEGILIGRWLFDEDSGVVHQTGLEPFEGETPAAAGAPRAETLAMSTLALWLTSGRFCVGGLVCENESCRPIDPGNTGVPTRLPAPGEYIIHLEAWQRLVTPVDDPSIAEIALDGVDTTVRTRTDWRVAVAGSDEWRRLIRTRGSKGLLKARRVMVSEILGNRLYRVEIHHGGWSAGSAVDAGQVDRFVIVGMPHQLGGGTKLKPVGGSVIDYPIGRPVEIIDDGPHRREAPTVAWVINAEANSITIDWVPPEGETDTPVGLRPVATFKWSRDNGSIAARVMDIGPSMDDTCQIALRTTPRTATEISAGSWAELDTGDPSSRHIAPLVLIKDVHRDASQDLAVDVTPPPPAEGPDRTVTLTVWQPAKAAPKPGAIVVRQGKWLDLENGVQVRFEGTGMYRSGDFWGLPARNQIQNILWPTVEKEPVALPSFADERRTAPLATLIVERGRPFVRDLRRIFVPLAEMAVPGGEHPIGSLAVNGDLLVDGNALIAGYLKAGLIKGHLGPNTVDTPQIVDRSVTEEKLATLEGMVPFGYSILGDSDRPPPGYAFTGSMLTSYPEHPAWHVVDAPLPQAGWVAGAELDGKLYLFWEDGALWRYDPACSRGVDPYTMLAPMPGPKRTAFAAAALGGRIYAVGGIDERRGKIGLTLGFDPKTGTWAECAPMGTPRSHHGCAAIGGRLYAFGGVRTAFGGLFPNWITSRTEAYDPERNVWYPARSMPCARFNFATAVGGGHAHAVGGETRWLCGQLGRRLLRWHHAYDPAIDRWRRLPPLPGPVSRPGTGLVEGKLYVFGGETAQGPTAAAARYDDHIRRWHAAPALHQERAGAGAAVADGTLYAIGGRSAGAAVDTIEALSVVSYAYVHRRVGTVREVSVVEETIEVR